MANDPNKNDWFKAGLVSPNNTLGDFKVEGLTGDNTQLLSKEDYKDKDYVKETFVNDKGKFDEDGFNKFYEQQQATFNSFVKDEYDDEVLNGAYAAEQNYLAPVNAPRRDIYKIRKERVANPDQQVKGFNMYNSSMSSPLTVRELAQRSKVFDPITNKYEDYSPNDLGFWGTTFAKDTLVLSTWESDGKHYDSFLEKEVEHKKGEHRLNEDGNYQYEKLGNRSVYGRQALNPINVITRDGSFANKFDFMDSDSRTKSYTGTIFKTAAEIAPYVIPKVKSVWIPVTLVKSLMLDLLPVLSKSVGGIIFGDSVAESDYMKSMDKLQGIGARFNSDNRSDAGTDSVFNRENVLGLASDVFAQIAQQRMLAEIPMMLGSSRAQAKVLAEAAKNPENAAKIKEALASLKGVGDAQERFSLLHSAFSNQPGLADVLNKYQRLSGSTGKALATFYMSGVSALGMHEEAKLAGLDDRDAGLLTMGLMASMVGLMKTDIGEHTLDKLGLDDLSLFYKKATREEFKRVSGKLLNVKSTNGAVSMSSAATATVDPIAKRAWYNNLFTTGKNIGSRMVDKIKSGIQSDNPMIRHSIAESLEEISEEGLSDLFKGVYNGLNAMGVTSTRHSEGFEFSGSDMLSRYMMAGFGGAIGGSIMGAQMAFGGKVHTTLPESLKTELASIVIHGQADGFRKQLKKEFDSGKFPGNKNLSGKVITDADGETIYEPAGKDGGMSQREMIYHTINAELDFLEDVIYQEGDINNLELKPIYQLREAKLLNLQQNSAISDDMEDKLRMILDLQAEIKSIEGGIKDATAVETQVNQSKITGLKLKAKQAREDLDDILNGKHAREYVGHAVFHLNEWLSKPYGVKDKNSYAESIYNKPFELLNDEQKAEIEEGYENYLKLGIRTASKIGYARFKKDMEIVTKHKEGLNKFVEQRRALLDGGVIDSFKGEEDPTAESMSRVYALLINLQEDLDQAIQNPEMLERSQTDIPVTQAVIAPDGTSVTSGANIFESYINLLKKDKYVNPELVAFLKKYLDVAIPVSYIDSNGKQLRDLDSIVTDLTIAAIEHDTNFEYPFNFFEKLGNELKIFLNSNFSKLTYSNIEEIFERLENHGFTSENIDSWMENNLEYLYNPSDSDSNASISVAEPEENSRAKEFFLKQYDGIIANLKQAFYSGISNEGSGVFAEAGEQEILRHKEQMIRSAAALAKVLKEKEVSPFYEMLNELIAEDGVTGMETFIDVVARQYSDSHKSPESFIINSGMDVSKLKYGISVIDRVNALMMASTTWEEQDLHVNKLIGYTNAMNNLTVQDGDTPNEPLPEFDSVGFETIVNDLATVKERAKLMLAISEFNINGTVRESKMLGAKALTLYMSSMREGGDNFELLKSSGLDITELQIAMSSAEQFLKNMESIQSTSDKPIPFDTSDAAFIKLKKEADKIEQAVYKLFNDENDSDDVRVDKLRNLIAKLDPAEVDFTETTSFAQNTKDISRIQEVFYLFQSATVDAKQFYNDLAGDPQADVNDLTNSKLVPFLNQELIIKQLFFFASSKYKKGIDVYGELMQRLLPVTNAEEADRLPEFGNREDLLTLHNAIFLDGIPGAGKTSTAANFLNKMIARYGLTIATFAPHAEQITNLNNTLEYRENLINPENSTLNDLFRTVFGDEVYELLNRDTSPLDKSNADSSVITNTAEIQDRLKANKDALGYEVDKINTDHPMIADLLTNFERFLINGAVPNVIVIDEATHITLHNLELLSRLIDIHNSKNTEKISLVLLGDTEQNGANVDIKSLKTGEVFKDKSNLVFSNIYSTPKLSQAFRSFYSTINENVSAMRLFKSNALYKGSVDEDVMNTLTLKFKVDSKEGLIGFKPSTFSKEDIELIFDKRGDEKVVLITDKIDSEALEVIRSLGISEDAYDIVGPTAIQGLERDYVIVDLKSSGPYQVTSKSLLQFDTDMSLIYTSLTRAKKGALINENASGAINLKGTSINVEPYKVELNKGNLDAYRALTLKTIKESHSELEDLPQNFTLDADNTKPITPVNVSDQELATMALSAGSLNNISKEGVTSDTIGSLVTTSGQATTSDDELAAVIAQATSEMSTKQEDSEIKGLSLSYMFHERLGVLVHPATKLITDVSNIEGAGETNNTDIMYLAKALNFYDPSNPDDLTELNENLEFLREQLKRIRTAAFTYATNPSNQRVKFSIHLHKAGVDVDLINEIKGDIDLWIPKIMIRPYDRFDDAYSTMGSESDLGGGSIAYLILADPNDPSKHISIAAMPNINNPKVPKVITQALQELYAQKAKLHGSDIGYFDYTDKIIQASNLVLHKAPALKSYDEFVAEHSHLVVSEPLIISSDLFTNDEVKELDPYLSGMSVPLTSDTTNKYRFRGLPFMLVSTDASLQNDTAALLTRFKAQVKASAVAGKFIPGDVRLVFLRPKARSFSGWFNWNADLGARFNNGEIGISKDLAAAENNYVAAKILARFTSMLAYYNTAKANTPKGTMINYRSFLPDSLMRGPNMDHSPAAVNQRVDEFMQKIQGLMNIAIPATFKMTYIEYVTKLTNYGISDISEAGIALSELFKRSDSEIKDLQKNFYDDSQEFANGTAKAREHYITKQMLNFINNKTSSATVELLDENDAALPLNKSDKGALINMVVALRTALSGGSFKLNGVSSGYQQGVFGNSLSEKNDFIKQLDSIITSSDQGTYSTLFPGGISSNIVYRRRNDTNKFTGALPFAMEVGVETTELQVDVDVQLPKLFINLAAINLDGSASSKHNPTSGDPVIDPKDVIKKAISNVSVEVNAYMNARRIDCTDLVSDGIAPFDPQSAKNILALTADVFASEHEIAKKFNETQDYSDNNVNAVIQHFNDLCDAVYLKALNEALLRNVAASEDTSPNADFVTVTNRRIYGNVVKADGGYKLRWKSAPSMLARYVKDIDLLNTLSTTSDKFNELVSQGYTGEFRSLDGTEFFYVLKNADKSEIFGKFVLSTKIDDATGYPSEIDSEFKYLQRNASKLDLTDFNDFKKYVNTMLKDNTQSLAIFNAFVQALEVAVQNDFADITNEAAIKELSSAYLSASIAVKDDPGALQALQDLYRDFINTKKC